MKKKDDLPSDGRYGAAAMSRQHRRFNLASITLRTLASDIRAAILTGSASSETLAVWHALIAQELARLGEPNSMPTDKEIDSTSGSLVLRCR